MLLSFMTSATLGQAMPCHLSEKKKTCQTSCFSQEMEQCNPTMYSTSLLESSTLKMSNLTQFDILTVPKNVILKLKSVEVKLTVPLKSTTTKKPTGIVAP